MKKFGDHNNYIPVVNTILSSKDTFGKHYNSDPEKGFSRSFGCISNENNNFMNIEYPNPTGWVHLPQPPISILK